VALVKENPVRYLRRFLVVASAAAVMGVAPEPRPFFPGGRVVQRRHGTAPMVTPLTPESARAWRTDLEKIRDLGFNTVRTWVEWSAGEPREASITSRNLDLMLRLAADTGLRVIVQVYVDSAPDWVGRKYRMGRFVSQGGTVIPSQAAPGFCFDHPGVRDAMLGFYREVARHARGSQTMVAYDVWSEPAVMNWAQPAYVPNAQFLLLPVQSAALPRVAAAETQDDRRTQPRVVPDLQRMERRGAAPVRHHPHVCRLHGLARLIGEKIATDLKARVTAVKDVDAVHLVTSHAPNPSPVFRTLADAMDAPTIT